jgi:hypothetical protein
MATHQERMTTMMMADGSRSAFIREERDADVNRLIGRALVVLIRVRLLFRLSTMSFAASAFAKGSDVCLQQEEQLERQKDMHL